MPSITVIVPTALAPERSAVIERAVASALAQEGVQVEVMLVVNGTRFEPALLAKWRADTRVRVEYLELGSAPAAVRHGRSLIRTPYFSFLDDDDVYIENTLFARVAPMLEGGASAPDMVVCNGQREVDGGFRRCFSSMAQFTDDPLRGLLKGNWLGSSSAVFRSDSVGLEYFDGRTRYMEWTVIAYRCALNRRIRFIEDDGFRIHSSPNSLSKSQQYREGAVVALDVIAGLGLPPDVRTAIARKRADALHELAEAYRLDGRWRDAWLAHLTSLRGTGGLRYLAYTRHLLSDVAAHLGR
ncbi:MAG: glycosyltransferase [Gammaproteobacteria bacterium]|nr:glycosyltransferase [Gammaproteobacteria bacterium]